MTSSAVTTAGDDDGGGLRIFELRNDDDTGEAAAGLPPPVAAAPWLSLVLRTRRKLTSRIMSSFVLPLRGPVAIGEWLPTEPTPAARPASLIVLRGDDEDSMSGIKQPCSNESRTRGCEATVSSFTAHEIGNTILRRHTWRISIIPSQG